MTPSANVRAPPPGPSVAVWELEAELRGLPPRPFRAPRSLAVLRVFMAAMLVGLGWLGFAAVGHEPIDFPVIQVVVWGTLAVLAVLYVGAEMAAWHALHLARTGYAVPAEVEACEDPHVHPLLAFLAIVGVLAAACAGADVTGDASDRVRKSLRYRYRLPGGDGVTRRRNVSMPTESVPAPGQRVTVLVDPDESHLHDLYLRVRERVRVEDGPQAV